MEETAEDIAKQLVEMMPKRSKAKVFLKKVSKKINRQISAIIGSAFAICVGTVIARIVWEWIKFVFNY